MFEDSLVESTGRIRTRSSRYAAGSFVLETALVAVILLIPYLYPDALPRKFLSVPLIAPPPAPAAPIAAQPTASATRPQPLVIDMTVPTIIPHDPVQIVDNPPGPVISGMANLGGSSTGPLGINPLGLSTPPPIIPAHPARPTGPLHVSVRSRHRTTHRPHPAALPGHSARHPHPGNGRRRRHHLRRRPY
jgi:protein TonB